MRLFHSIANDATALCRPREVEDCEYNQVTDKRHAFFTEHFNDLATRLGFYDPKQRYYLGFCHPETAFPARIATFIQHKDVMLAMPAGVPGISGKVRKTSRNYLSRFFKILESPEKMEKSIIQACHPWPPSPDDHTRPPGATGSSG